MNKYHVIRYSPLYYNIWNDFVGNAKNATFLFHRDFIDYHKERFVDSSVLIFKEETLIALMPANSNQDKVFSHLGLSYGGLVLNKTIEFKDVLESVKALLIYFYKNGIKKIQFKLLPKIYHLLPSDEIDYLLFKLKARIIRRDLSNTIDNFNRLEIKDKNRIRGLKRAIKNGLKIKEVDHFEAFWNTILIPNLNEKHYTKPVHSLEEIESLKKNFPNNIRQFNVYKDKNIVAGVTVFETKKVAHVQYISANQQKQQLGSLDLIFDYLINQEFKNKPYFDFGISNEDQGKQVNFGLMYWKESFGGRSIVHDFYEINVANYYLLESTFI